jgi:hypothetical protein
MIQDELGIQDKVNLKIYMNGEELSDEKVAIKDSGIVENGGSIEVEVTIKISIEV